MARSRIVSALAARRLVCARLIGSAGGHRGGPRRIKNDRSSPGRKVVPSAVPPSFGVCRTHRDRRAGRLPARSALPCIAGALRRSLLGVALGARRSVRRLPGPFPVVVAPVRTSHRISGSTRDGYSSRSQPVFGCAGQDGRAPGSRQATRLSARGVAIRIVVDVTPIAAMRMTAYGIGLGTRQRP